MLESNYQSSNESAIESVGEASSSEARSNHVRSELRKRAKALEGNQYEMGELLTECKSNGYYRKECETFEQFVDQKLSISIRMAQLLMQVYRKSKEIGLTQAQVLETGISKLSALNKVLTKDNARELLEKTKTQSLREVKKVADTLADASGEKRKEPRKKKPILTLTDSIRRALSLASEATGQDDVQMNLEYIANSFLTNSVRGSVCRPSLN